MITRDDFKPDEFGKYNNHKLVFGVGINDADYFVERNTVSMGRYVCPYFQAWKGMLRRSCCPKLKEKHPTYKDVTVCEDWSIFSNFRDWMEKQDWTGKHLDKDIILPGNKMYRPDACCFVDAKLNTFINERAACRGDCPIGVTFEKISNKYIAQCQNPFSKKYEKLGRFGTPQEAHLAWKKRKHEFALKFAELQSDRRVSDALLKRYA